MEKNRNKSDLLAAGRKKLQQFRQKKDNKGSSSSVQQHQRKSSSNKTAKSGNAAAHTDGVIPELPREAELAAPSQAVPIADTDGGSGNLADLPVIASLVTLAGGVSESTTVFERELVPVVTHWSTAVKHTNGGVWDEEGLERVASGLLSVEDAKGVSSDTCVGAMQGASCSSADQHDESYKDGCQPALQGESTDFWDLGFDGEKDEVGVSISGDDGVMEGDAVAVQCLIPEGAQQLDESSIYVQETANAEENASSSHVSLETGPLINENERDRCSSTLVNVETGLGEPNGDPSTDLNQRFSADQEVYDALSSENNHERGGNLAQSSLSLTVETSKASPVAMDHVVDDDRTEKDGDVCLSTQLSGAQELDNFCIPPDASPNSEIQTACKQETGVSSSETSGIQYKSGDVASNDADITVASVDEEVSKRVNFQENFESDSGLGLRKCLPASFGYDLGQLEESQQILIMSAVSTGFRDRQGIVFSKSYSVEEIECLKKHLYLTNVTKDFLSLQLEEQTEVTLDNDTHFSEELSRIRNLMKEAQEGRTRAQKELFDCRSELQTMTLNKEELENSFASARGEVETLNNRACEFQDKFEECQEGSAVLLAELAECKGLLGDLQMENLKLKADLILETDERKKLNDEREHLIHENTRLASELLEQKEQLVFALNKQVQLDNDLKESMAFLEQLTEENISLSTSLNMFRCKLEDLNDLHQALPESQSGDRLRGSHVQDLIGEDATYNSQTVQDKCDEESHLHKLEDSVSTCLGQQSVHKDSGDIDAFDVLKGHLDGFEIIVDKTENIICSLHSHSMSLSRSANKVSASGVSKLIQAFESNINIDDTSPALPPIEGERSADSLIFAKEQTQDLRVTLEQLGMDVEKAAMLFKTRQEKILHVQELEVDCASSKLRNDDLQVKYDELVNRLSDYKPIVDKLQNQINYVSRNADEEAERFLNQIELLQEEVDKFSTILESEKSPTRDSISEALEKLEASTGLSVSSNLDICARVNASVGTAVKVIDGLHEKLEGLCLDFDTKRSTYETLLEDHIDMQKKEQFAVAILLRICSALKELIKDPSESEVKELINAEDDDKLEVIQGNNEILIEQLKKLLDDRLLLLNAKCELESELQNRNQGEEELKEKCIVLTSNLEDLLLVNAELESLLMDKNHEIEGINNRCFALSKELEDHKMESLYKDVADAGGNSCSTPLSHLEALVASLCQKYEEAAEQISLSEKCLREVISSPESLDNSSMPLHVLLCEELIPKVMEVSELQEKVQLLSSSILQQEIEVQALKESLSEMEEALESSRSVLHVKVTELEESEQRLSSVREKLSIAVAKGKGLIVQRDGLKQSLSEKSGELEKCLQDLQSKEAMLHEVEAKLKSYSEAGRVEALESELSYIRNSATAFRDSFLLKDSILQRVEEVLEDLDLPEHFHSKDIIEKIELLARSAAGKPSFLLTDEDQKIDEDQKNSLGGSYSDASYRVVDPWKENLQATSSTELHDLRKKCVELQNKYYGLAEQNDMLEQSLMERNKLVQWWEEVVDRIEMPPNLRSMDSEFKIEWLMDTLSEVRQERDSLLLKMDNLVESNDSLAATLNESQWKLSELNSELTTIKYEREFLSKSLDKLRHETLEFSDKAVQDELHKDCLQKEIMDLKEKLVEVNKDHHDFLNKIKKLQYLVCGAFPDQYKMDTFTGDDTKDLERILIKLVDNYKLLNLGKSTIQGSIDHASGQCSITPEEQKMKDLLDEKERNLILLKAQLDEVAHDLVLMKDEKDTNLEKLHSLILEVEATTKQKNVLLEERDAAMDKYDSLVLEIDTMCKQRDALQEQLNQEVQRSASIREKLNVAVRKGKALVQQRDSLKQTIEERNVELKQLQNELNRRASENLSLGNELAQARHSLADSEQALNSLSEALHSIDIGEEVSAIDPIQRFKEFAKLCGDWRAAAVSHEHEAKKAKKASGLLLAELNEVQERTDVLQEGLSKAETALAEYSKHRDELEAARVSALSQLDHFMTVSSEESKKHLGDIIQLEAGVFELRKLCFSVSYLLARIFYEDSNFFNKLETNAQSILKLGNGASAPEQSVLSSGLQANNLLNEEKSPGASELFISEHLDDSSISEHLVLSTRGLHECVEELGRLTKKIHNHSFDTEQQARSLSTLMDSIEREVASQKLSLDTLRREMGHLEIAKNQKETEVTSLQRNLALLYETCRRSVMEIKSRKAQAIGKDMDSEVNLSEKVGELLKLPDSIGEEPVGKHNSSFTERDVKNVADILLSTVEGLVTLEEQISQDNQKELKSMISDLQHELQDKDIQNNRICGELVSQIRDAEAAAEKYSVDLDSARYEIHKLENKVKVLENDKELLELKVNETINLEASSKDFQEKIRLLTDSLYLKDQEIEGLMQALDEEESQLEGLERRNQGLEKLVEEKALALGSLEASRAKAVAKLSTTMNKFDELRFLSESLVAEVENLQFQLQERDSDISFLRQEVTRCTKDVIAEQEINKKNSTKIHQLQKWLGTIASQFGVSDMYSGVEKHIQPHEYTESLERQVSSVMAKLDELQKNSQNKDALLELERNRIEEHLSRVKSLETSLHEKESQIELFQQGRDSGQLSTANSVVPLEIETVRNKGAALSSVAPLIRSGRKANSDHVAIGIDLEQENMIQDEDDDKAHGFKALTMSRIVPKATRPVTERIDGLWVSIERLLMRQPTLRLGLIIYWVALHAMLAASI